MICGPLAAVPRAQEQASPQAASPAAPADDTPPAPADVAAEPEAVEPPEAGATPPNPAAQPKAPRTPRSGGPKDGEVPFGTPISPAARIYSAKARKALTLETQVQEYERATYGMEDPQTLQGTRKERSLRIEKDRSFAAVAGAISIRPLSFPDPNQAPEASRETLAFFAALHNAYEATRNTSELDRLSESNQTFLKTANWSARDRAVELRDRLVEQGVLFTTLAQRAWDLREGTLSEDVIPELTASLHALVPPPAEQASDLAVLVLQNPTLRASVFTELSAILAVPLAPPEPLPPAAELSAEVATLQQQLLEQAGLTAVLEKQANIDTELARVESELETMPSKGALDRKVKLVTRRAELEEQRYATELDPALFEQLVEAQEQLARRRMDDLGPPGALFGARLDAVVAAREATDDTAWSRWMLLEEQRELLVALEGARPARTPLQGLVPPPLYGLGLLEKAQQDQAAKKAAESKAGAGKNVIFGKKAPPKSAKKPTPQKQGGGGAKSHGQKGYGPKG